MYTQFCDRYRKFKKDNKITLHKEHKAGEEVEVDWAGDTMSYVEPSTGEIMTTYLFVAVLPTSSYPFVYAYDGDMKTPNWIDAHVRTYTYFGGVPKFTISDNTKTAVIKTDLVDPKINKSYNEMAKHFSTTLIPARHISYFTSCFLLRRFILGPLDVCHLIIKIMSNNFETTFICNLQYINYKDSYYYYNIQFESFGAISKFLHHSF